MTVTRIYTPCSGSKLVCPSRAEATPDVAQCQRVGIAHTTFDSHVVAHEGPLVVVGGGSRAWRHRGTELLSRLALTVGGVVWDDCGILHYAAPDQEAGIAACLLLWHAGAPPPFLPKREDGRTVYDHTCWALRHWETGGDLLVGPPNSSRVLEALRIATLCAEASRAGEQKLHQNLQLSAEQEATYWDAQVVTNRERRARRQAYEAERRAHPDWESWAVSAAEAEYRDPQPCQDCGVLTYGALDSDGDALCPRCAQSNVVEPTPGAPLDLDGTGTLTVSVPEDRWPT